MFRDPMGLRTGGDRFESRDCGGLPDFSSSFTAPAVDSSGDGETFSSYTTTSSGASYDGSSSNSHNGNYSFVSDASLSSYLMDGNVRAMLKKVTVNENTLNQTIQSLGGGEKGLKELMGYIMSWVQEHQHENTDSLSLSHSLESLNNNKPSPVQQGFGYGQGCLDDQLYQPCSKSRRVGDRSDVYSGAGAVGGGLHEGFQYPVMQQPQQQPVNSFFSFASGQYDLNRPGRDDLSRSLGATTNRAARRNRIARQRQHSLPRNASTPAAWTGGAPALSMGTFHPQPVVVPGRKANNTEMLTLLLQKELRPSDVGNLGRIILPKKEAEMHLPILALREGVLLLMEDFDTGYCWNIRYRFWPNNKSRMYLLENTGELVKQHQLQEGDLLILYRNLQGNYVLRGKKKVPSESRGGVQQKNAHSLARGFPEASKTEEVLKEIDYGFERGFGLEFQEQSCQKTQCKDNNIVAVETGPQAVKAEPVVLVGDDDPFFKEDVMHNIGSTFGPGLLQPLERFPSLNLDFPLDEIMAGIPKDNSEDESTKVVPKPEPAG